MGEMEKMLKGKGILFFHKFAKKAVRIFFMCILIAGSILGSYQNAKNVSAADRWQKLFDKYRYDKNVNRLIFVKYISGSDAELIMYRKKGNIWIRILDCPALVGENGIDKKREGDRKTPTGNFTPTIAFGLRKNPGTGLHYKKINKYLYWSGDEEKFREYSFKDQNSRKEFETFCESLVEKGSPENRALSYDGTGIKELVSFGGSVEGLVPPCVEKAIALRV